MEKILDKSLNVNAIDLTGKRFGKLIVIELDHKKQSNYDNGRKRTFYYWKCKCDCGNEVVRSGNSLRDGYTKSCGCNQVYENRLTHNMKKNLQIKVDTKRIDLIGKVFSKLMVIGLDHKEQITYKNGKKRTRYYWKCMCECGNEVVRLGESLRKGATKSCGCFKFHQQMLNQEKKKYLKSKKQNEIIEEFE